MDFSEAFILDTVNLLNGYFNEIIRINLTKDIYELVQVNDDNVDMITLKEGNNKLSEWLSWFPTSGLIHSDDVVEFSRFSNINHIRRKIRKKNDRITFRYRRKVDNGDYSWTMMELVPSVEYSNDNEIVMMYIRDINLDYSKDYNYRCKLEKISMKDDLTGIQNRYTYNRKVKGLSKFGYDNIGVLFADINALKHVNDTNGHVSGDNLIIEFSNLLTSIFDDKDCYRISGDEFVVIVKDKGFDEFKMLCKKLDNKISSMNVPIASIGYMYSTDNDIDMVLKEVEKLMYIRKNGFYKKFPEFKR